MKVRLTITESDCRSGYFKTGEEFIELKWVDGIYLEVFLAWCTALGFAVAWAFCELYEFYLHSKN